MTTGSTRWAVPGSSFCSSLEREGYRSTDFGFHGGNDLEEQRVMMVKETQAPAKTDYESFLESKSQFGSAHGSEPSWIPDFLFPFQKKLVEWAIEKGRAAIFADCGLGKALASDTPVMTPTGRVPIGHLRPGDTVIGRDGCPIETLGVYPQGTRKMFRVRFSDGTSIRADSEHLWYVQSQLQRYRRRPGRVLTTSVLAASRLRDGVGRHRHFVPLVSAPVMYQRRSLPIDPYLLGVLLGDGSLSRRAVEITTADEDLALSLVLPDRLRIVRRVDDGTRAPTYRLSRERAGSGHRNALVVALEAYGLLGLYSSEKYIPEDYLYANPYERLALLQGLMDTDGYGNQDGLAQYTSTSRKLTLGMQELALSLGGHACIREKHPVCVKPDGDRVLGAIAWNVSVRLPHSMSPFRLKRKRESWRPHSSYSPCRAITAIESDGKDDATCIAVRTIDQLFVAGDHVVTHNTPMQLVWAQNVVEKTNRPVLILTPLAVAQQTIREARKFEVPASRSAGGAHRDKLIVVTNYEKLHKFDAANFGGVVCDESSKDWLMDFPGDIIRLHAKVGFHYIARYHVWKEPFGVRMRTMVKGLAHQTIVEDSAQCTVASADYLLVFRRSGTNAVPITHPTGFADYAGERPIPNEVLRYKDWDGKQTENKYSQWIWRQYASAFWDDVRISRVLPYKPARDKEDERHIHPLQLDVIDRCLVLWSNVGETVLTPFMWVGSEVYGAVRSGRRGIGIELKPSYYRQALKNIAAAKTEHEQPAVQRGGKPR